MKRTTLVCLILGTTLLIAGCASKPAPTPPTSDLVNKTCPLMGDPANPSYQVEYKGGKVGLCCSRCVERWKDMTNAERDAALMKVLNQ